MGDLIYKEESYEIIGACMEVHKILGPGYLESVYQEALSIEMHHQAIPHQREYPIQISYKGTPLPSRFIADFLCYDAIILELKAIETVHPAHEAQLLHYLHATGMPLGMLINFGASSLYYRRYAATHRS